MGQLVEVVFENVHRAVGHDLAQDILTSSSGIIDVVVDGEAVENAGGTSAIFPPEAQWVFVRLASIDLGQGVRVPNAGVRLVQHGEFCDVELNADLDDVTNQETFANALFEFSKRLAAVRGVKSYFAGLEPAGDLDTRLFTGESQGPLRLGTS